RAARELDLEVIVTMALRAREQDVGGVGERGVLGWLAAERRFGRAVAPGLVSDAAECQTRLADALAVDLQGCCDRDQGEGIGQPVANLEIAVVRSEALRWQLNTGDDFVLGQIIVTLGRVARQAVEILEGD